MAEWFDAPFWALLSLIIFLGILVYLKVPGVITGALDKRGEGIRKDLDDARRLRGEAEALLAEYRKKAEEAEAEASAIIDQARREADALSVEAKQRMEEYVASRTRLAEQKIAQAEAQALQEVRALSADVAIAAAEKILADRVKGGAGEALIARSIEDVKSKLN